MTAPPSPAPQPGRFEKFAQVLVLLIGGGVGGVLTTLATNALEWRKVTQKAEADNAAFVEKYLVHVLDKDIHVRFRLAEYFSHVLESDTSRALWGEYRKKIENQYLALNNEYLEQVNLLDKNAEEVKKFAIDRRLKRIESYLGESRELTLSFKPEIATPPSVKPAEGAAAKVDPSHYQVYTQFAGTLQREQVRLMMLELSKVGWKMEGASGGGERTPSAAGQNEIRYGSAEDKAAAEALAGAVQKFGLNARGIIAVYVPIIRPKTLEIWISK